MKKEILALLLIFVSMNFVFAMEDSITVKALPNNYIKVYAYGNGGTPFFDMNGGVVDSNGIFSTTFFAVNEPEAMIRVLVIEGNEKGELLQKAEFDKQDLSSPLTIDCTSICKIKVIDETETVLVPEVENATKTIENTSETLMQTTVENISAPVENTNSSNSISSTGKAIFTKADGSINYPVLGGIAAVVVIVILIIFVIKRKSKSKSVVIDPEEKELEELEFKVKEKEEEINKIKDEQGRKQRIDDAKRKLFSEEKELKRLTGVEDEDYVKMKKIEEARKRLAQDERKLNHLQSSTSTHPRHAERQNMRDNPAVKGFLDNMKKYSDDKK